MSEERLKEIKDSIDLQYDILTITKGSLELIEEEIELYNEVVRLKKENNKLTDSEVLTEFEKWLMSDKIMFYRGSDNEILISYGEVRYKLQELKGEIK